MIRVELVDCYIARCGNLVVDRSNSRKGSAFLDLCRKLLDSGRSPTSIVHVYRKSELCLEPRTLEVFAGYYVAESDNASHGPRLKRWSPKIPLQSVGDPQSTGKDAILA